MRPTTVHLGFEVASGEPVSIPLRHMVITGQTQEAGKTTALEALVARSEVKAVAFITKRGEGSFAEARIIPPYFREQADWKYVAAILEASRSEKLKFERPWIIRVSRGAKTLADVQRNVRKAMESAKGMNADMYLVLDAYLDDVVPQISRVRWADRVDLGPGVNAMDLTALSGEMQHLVIRSTIEWALDHAEDTVVVVPEAWKFIPQGRGTPVKLAAEAYIRQAAALRNYLWLDSQDIAGVEKIILKSVPVWILGVQRESNEVKRTLAQIPAGIKKPKPEAIATLELGQFYACHGKHITKVYAQPIWMTQGEACGVAMGRIERPSPPLPQEVQVNEREATALREENAQLRREVAGLSEEVGLLRRQMGQGAGTVAPSSSDSAAARAPRRGRQDTGAADSTSAGAPLPSDGDIPEGLYEAIKRRLQAEAPMLLKTIVTKPALRVEVERKVLEASEDSLRGRLAQLMARGFFAEPATGGDVQKEFARSAYTVSPGSLYPELDNLARLGFLVIRDGKDERSRPRKEYQLVQGMEINIVDMEAAGV